MEMRLHVPVTRGYFFLLGALRLVNAALPQNINQKKISSGTQGTTQSERKNILCYRTLKQSTDGHKITFLLKKQHNTPS